MTYDANFRLFETVAVEAIRNGKERITLHSFDGDNLLLPLGGDGASH
ncbi:hypothetical protein G6K87_24065 (plasmid) [Agrobacterium tumefaciens]|nr:hypothetical protein [Agrobacterium tumefaciens]NSY04599.1 hypothetical protein [Agrobacterium tumefaciens]